MYKLTKVAISLILMVSSTSGVVLGANDQYPEISSETDQLRYLLGGGRVVPLPGSNYITTRVTANLQANISYSCGKFDFQNNLSQMINQLEDQVREIPMQLQNAVSAAIAGLPGYLMRKVNINLFDTLQQSLDESAELFRLSYKSCETMEQEMRNNDSDYNPYNGFIRAVVAEKWVIGGDSGQTIDEIKKEVAEDQTGPITWLGGNEYGTIANPIQINHDLTVAGYNIMLGRTGDVSTDELPIESLLSEPIVKIWPRPTDAGKWIQLVVGDLVIITDDSGSRSSISGKGLREVVSQLEPEIEEAIDLAINTFDFSLIKNYPSLKTSRKLIDALRNMPGPELEVYRERIISELTVNEVIERVALIRQMLYLGLQNPENVVARISSETSKQVRKKTFPDLNSKVIEIVDNLKFKQQTILSTTLKVLQQYQARQTKSASESATPYGGSTNLLRGGVPLN